MARLRLAVFVSGSGSNLQAIIDCCRDPACPAEVVVVVSNRAGVYALERAAAAGVPALVVEHRGFMNRGEHEREILRRLEPYRPQLVVLAGYMRVVTPVLLEACRDHRRGLPGVVNIHPADTRAYQGAHGYEFALGMLPEHPRRLEQTWITVHFVDAGVDTGPIIAQAPVPVLPGDDLDTLKQRGLAVEHRLYPEVIRLLAEGRVELKGKQVFVDGKPAGLAGDARTGGAK
ncbi:MAG: phosphoribosylglycinamide formyltransferase [Deltaproteobacteria bacterium]|nr:MAG: phosphoribosylglycinamide formyltransferase [Deltaproteobacteria bacterium]